LNGCTSRHCGEEFVLKRWWNKAKREAKSGSRRSSKYVAELGRGKQRFVDDLRRRRADEQRARAVAQRLRHRPSPHDAHPLAHVARTHVDEQLLVGRRGARRAEDIFVGGGRRQRSGVTSCEARGLRRAGGRVGFGDAPCSPPLRATCE
jgi:hypothetical protein